MDVRLYTLSSSSVGRLADVEGSLEEGCEEVLATAVEDGWDALLIPMEPLAVNRFFRGGRETFGVDVSALSVAQRLFLSIGVAEDIYEQEQGETTTGFDLGSPCVHKIAGAPFKLRTMQRTFWLYCGGVNKCS